MSCRIYVAGAACLALLCPAVHAQSAVRLLEAGAAPRELLRYSLKADSSERAGMDMSMRMSLALAGQQVPMMAVPPVRMEMDLRVAEVGTDGSARLEFELVSATASGDASQIADINRSLAALQGLSGWYRMDTQGNISASGVRLPDGGAGSAAGQMLGDLEQTLQQLAAPFPAEAVGNGARWQVSQNAQTAEIRISQTLEYTLRSRSGNRVALDVKVVDSKLESSGGLPPGTKLDSITVAGGGTTTVLLDRAVPTATMDADTTVVVSAEEQGQQQSMSINLKMKQSIAPAVR